MNFINNKLFEMLEATEHTVQREDHHPEIFVLNHSLQCFKIALRETEDIDLIIASLLHDIGKGVELYGHDAVGAEMIRDYVSAKTEWLVRQHMRVWDFLDGNMKRWGKVRELIEHPWLPELIHLSRIDKMGRKKRIIKYNRDTISDGLNKKLKKRLI
jgi:hypothetical protein